MRSTRFGWICPAALVLAAAVGCSDRKGDTAAPPPPGETKPGSPSFFQAAVPAKKYYPALKKEQVDRVMSAEIQSETQVIAILGEPTERSETRRWFNAKYNLNMEEYKLTWYLAEGKPAVQITFLNNIKTQVLSGIGG
jgi:hypothetical protein